MALQLNTHPLLSSLLFLNLSARTDFACDVGESPCDFDAVIDDAL